MKNRYFLTLCILPILASSLTSCGNKDKDTIELKIGFWPENTETQDLAMYNQWKEAFEKDYPQYKIVGMPYTYSTETIGTVALSGQLPTVFQTWFTEPGKLVNNGYIRSIDAQLKNLGWDKMMDTEMKDTLTFNNQIYGIPRDGYGLGLLINKKTFGENGLLPDDGKGGYLIHNPDGSPAYPTTFEEILEASIQIHENDDKAGILILSSNKNGGWQYSNFAWNFGATLQYEENGKIKSNLASDEGVAALDFIKELANNEVLIRSTSVVYDDWYNNIGDKVAMAIVGSDVLDLAYLKGEVSMDDLAFVPMPTGNGKDRYSLYGGTPYVFSAEATDEQVEGILRFFEYIGRSPIISDISKEAMVLGYETALKKNQPILPKINPWINQEYVTYQKELENRYVTVNMVDYKDFFDNIATNKHAEVPYGAQNMYELLDVAIKSVLDNPSTANSKALLTTANASMQQYLDKNYNK